MAKIVANIAPGLKIFQCLELDGPYLYTSPTVKKYIKNNIHHFETVNKNVQNQERSYSMFSLRELINIPTIVKTPIPKANAVTIAKERAKAMIRRTSHFLFSRVNDALLKVIIRFVI